MSAPSNNKNFLQQITPKHLFILFLALLLAGLTWHILNKPPQVQPNNLLTNAGAVNQNATSATTLPLNDDNKTVIQLSKELEQIIRKNKTQASLYPEEKIAIENAIKALSTQIERQKTEFKQLENLKTALETTLK